MQDLIDSYESYRLEGQLMGYKSSLIHFLYTYFFTETYR